MIPQFIEFFLSYCRWFSIPKATQSFKKFAMQSFTKLSFLNKWLRLSSNPVANRHEYLLEREKFLFCTLLESSHSTFWKVVINGMLSEEKDIRALYRKRTPTYLLIQTSVLWIDVHFLACDYNASLKSKWTLMSVVIIFCSIGYIYMHSPFLWFRKSPLFYLFFVENKYNVIESVHVFLYA